MSDPNPESGKLTDRLLVIAVVMAVGAGAATYWFHAQCEGAIKMVKQEIRNYERMKKDAPNVVRTISTQRSGDTAGDGSNINTYLVTTFGKNGFSGFTIHDSKSVVKGDWKEATYTVNLRKKGKDSPVDRRMLINALSTIANAKPSLKTKSITLQFEKGEDTLTSANIVFAFYTR